jgi:hypothetical protein
VAGIKLASEQNPTTTVVMHNGDSITGATEMDRLELQTEWGKAEINGTAIDSVLFAQGLEWESEIGLNGTRWKLTEAGESQTSGRSAQTPKAPTVADSANTSPSDRRVLGSRAAAVLADKFRPGDKIVVTQDVELRIGSETVGSAKRNDVLTVESTRAPWLFVTADDKRGWLYSQFVSAVEERP